MALKKWLQLLRDHTPLTGLESLLPIFTVAAG